jgi:hypothetical protein
MMPGDKAVNILNESGYLFQKYDLNENGYHYIGKKSNKMRKMGEIVTYFHTMRRYCYEIYVYRNFYTR